MKFLTTLCLFIFTLGSLDSDQVSWLIIYCHRANIEIVRMSEDGPLGYTVQYKYKKDLGFNYNWNHPRIYETCDREDDLDTCLKEIYPKRKILKKIEDLYGPGTE